MLETVVLIHGLWMTGADMLLLKKRLMDCGYTSHIFHYPTVKKTPVENALTLESYVANLQEKKVHFVTHSLGGIVLLNYLHNSTIQKEGRAVLLGSPINGSISAENALKMPMFKSLLGGSVKQGLLDIAPRWQGEREIGMIAGSKSLGFGKLVGKLETQNDGTVLLSETRHPDLTEHLTLNVSHSELLFSKKVANNVCSFLHKGRFGAYQANSSTLGFDSWVNFVKDLFKK
jgi:pimeloyl-ACP methyl ester carboxylesterase